MTQREREILQKHDDKLVVIDESINEVSEKIDSMITRMDNIYNVLVPNELHGDGIIKRVCNLERHAIKQKNINWVVIATATSISFLVALLSKLKDVF